MSWRTTLVPAASPAGAAGGSVTRTDPPLIEYGTHRRYRPRPTGHDAVVLRHAFLRERVTTGRGRYGHFAANRGAARERTGCTPKPRGRLRRPRKFRRRAVSLPP